MAWAWSTRLPPMPKLVLMALADEADDSGFCFPSHRRLAWKCTTSERTVRRMVTLLASQHHLEIDPRFAKDGSRTSNGYRLALGDPPDKLTRGVATPDQGTRTALTRGMANRVRVTTTYPLSNPKPPQRRAAPAPPGRRETSAQCAGGRGGGDLCFPGGLTSTQRRGVSDQLAQLDPKIAQQLLDEIAGRMRVAQIRNPIRYCAALVSRWKRGEFAPELGLAVAEERCAVDLRGGPASPPSSRPPALPDTNTSRMPAAMRASLDRIRPKLEPQSSNDPKQCPVRPQETADGSSEP